MPPTTLISPNIPYIGDKSKSTIKPYNYTGVQVVIAFFVVLLGFALVVFVLAMTKYTLDKRQKLPI
jgi:hypothetical protein